MIPFVIPGVALVVLYLFAFVSGWVPVAATSAFLLALYFSRATMGYRKAVLLVVAGSIDLAIGFGLVHGFGRVMVGAYSFSAGKALLGLILVLCLPSPWRWTRACWSWLALAVTLLPLLGWLTGFVHFVPPVPGLALFALTNLPGTIAEDFYFRRFCQDHLARFGLLPEIAITAVLFGAVHLTGGVLFAALATVAGAIYAMTYRASENSVWAVVVVHWLVNVTRVVLFGVP